MYKRQDINYFEKNKTGVLVARMTSDMQSLNEFAREGASSIITALLTIFGATIAVFLVDVRLAFLSFLIYLVLQQKFSETMQIRLIGLFENGLDKFYLHYRREFLGLGLYKLMQVKLLN